MFVPRTQDTVAWLLLCTRLNDTQDIVVYIGITFSCQLFFSATGESDQRNLSVFLKPASRACFVLQPTVQPGRRDFRAGEKKRDLFRCFAFCLCGEKGSGSQFQGVRPETGSQSLFRADVTKLAPGACFAVCEGEKCLIDFARRRRINS